MVCQFPSPCFQEESQQKTHTEIRARWISLCWAKLGGSHVGGAETSPNSLCGLSRRDEQATSSIEMSPGGRVEGRERASSDP